MSKSDLEMAMEKVREVDRLFGEHSAEGMTIKEACKRIGIKYKFYDKWSQIVKDLYEPGEDGGLRLRLPAHQPAAGELPSPAAPPQTLKAPGRISVPISEGNYRILEQLAARRKMQISQLAAYGLSRAIEQNMI